MRHILSECLVDLIFVEVYRGLRVLQVLDIVEHIKRVFQRHEEVIHLIKAMSISDNLLEEQGEECSMPVKESAASGLAHDNLPAAHHFKLVVPILDLLEFPLIKHIGIDQTQAMLNYGLSELIKATLVALNDVHH